MSRDFQGTNQRGRSFKEDTNLNQANFSNADIRGADFSGANLTNANFTKAKINGVNFSEANLSGAILDEAICGVKTWWTISVFIISLFIMSLSGFSASIIISCNFHFFTGIRGINKNISTILISVIYVAWLHANFLKKYLPKIGLPIDQSYLIYIGIFIILIVGIFIPTIETMEESKNENMQIFVSIIFFSLLVVLINILLLILLPGEIYDMHRRVIGAFFGACLGIVISYEAIIKKEKKYVWIWNLFVYIISVQGTKFHSSNLNDASLFKANIKASSFLECTVIRTNWEKVKKIDCSRIKVKHLDNLKIRCLLIQKEVGNDKNYQDMNLRDLNLANANLIGIDLSRSDLSNSKLTGAKLQNSILSQTRLDNVDLSGANITETTIGIKSIPATAKLDALICDSFIESNSKQRYPNPEEKTSENPIKQLQKPVQINISFEQDGIDWQVFLQAFEKCLKEFNISPDNSEKLIQAFERQLNGNFVIRLNVPENIGKVEFKLKLMEEYKKSIEVLKIKYRKILKTSDIDFQENTSLLKITEQLANPETTIIQNIIAIGKNSMLQLNDGDIKIINNLPNTPLTETKNIHVKTILILAANPKTALRLRLDEEVREIDALLQRAKKRELFDLKQRGAVRVQEVYQSLLDFKPQIVHFCGHGSGDDGLVLEDETGNEQLVDTIALAKLFELFANTIECVVLNACYSEVQAQEIVKHIPYVIGMNKEIGDKAAIKFATGFYSALGAGESVKFAYKLGCILIQLDGIPEHLTPVLKKRL